MINVILIDANPDVLVMMRDRLGLLGSQRVRLVGVLANGADLDAMLSMCHADIVAVCVNALDTRSKWSLPGILPVMYTRRPYSDTYKGQQLIHAEDTEELLNALENIDRCTERMRKALVDYAHLK